MVRIELAIRYQDADIFNPYVKLTVKSVNIIRIIEN